MNRAQKFHDIDVKVNEIVRNEELSDYEKALKIEANIIIPLLDEIEELDKAVRDCGMKYEQLSDYVRKIHEISLTKLNYL